MLLSRDKRFRVTVIAKHMPGDYDIEYASMWAGANYLPYVPFFEVSALSLGEEFEMVLEEPQSAFLLS